MSNNNRQVRAQHADKMVALAAFLSDTEMSQGDINRATDCILLAYDDTHAELPALVDYAKKRILGKYLTRVEFDQELKAVQIHMQKWYKI